jgi:hypothetical protein
MARHDRMTNTLAIEPGVALVCPAADRRARVPCEPILAGAHDLFVSYYLLAHAPPCRVMPRGTYLGIKTCH